MDKKTRRNFFLSILFATGSIYILIRAIEKETTVFIWVGGIFVIIFIMQAILYLRNRKI